MKKIYKHIAIFLAVLLMFLPCDHASAVSYNLYGNARFGYHIKYPSFFQQSQPLPENGDGITMAGKKAVLLMWGAYAVLYDNGKEMKKAYKRYGHKMTAVKVNKNSLYFEEKKGHKITFHYSYFVDGGIISIELTCQKSKKKYFGKIVRKMVKSIKKENKTLTFG